MDARPIVIAPGEWHRVGNVEFLARTTDTPRFTFGGDTAVATPGTFVLVPPAWSTASATTAQDRCGCSTSTRRPASTGASG